MRRVRHQSVPGQIFGEYALASPARLLLAHALEAELPPGCLRTFDDEGRSIRVELVGMGPDPAMFGFFEDESEGVVEFLLGAKPNEFVLAQLDRRLKGVGEFVACPGIQAIGGD